MNPIDAVFQRLKAQKRKAFIPFLTACDPDPDGCVRLARALAGAGASLLEVGFPYSDPLADGPVIQASYTRVLERGLRLDDFFACAGRIAASPEFRDRQIPLVAMVSYSLVFRRGAAAFLQQAARSGFSGAVVPDLPADESEALARLCTERDFKLIQLVTPTTPPERARQIAQRSTGFLYCVSVTGITGARDTLPEALTGQLRRLRQETDLPLCVGFGISRPEQVPPLREVADGIIVGSALVRRVEAAASPEEAARSVGELARSLCAALNPPEPGASAP